MVGCTLVGGLAFAALAAPLPLWAMYLAMAVMGLALGIATTLSVTTVVDRTPAAARGTANSLRIMGNRLGQVSLPFGAGPGGGGSGRRGNPGDDRAQPGGISGRRAFDPSEELATFRRKIRRPWAGLRIG